MADPRLASGVAVAYFEIATRDRAKRGDKVAAKATLLVDCAANDLKAVPAKLEWGTNQSTWIVVDFAKATGIGATSR